MRIALVTGSLDVGGAETQVVRLAVELAARGHDVCLFVQRDDGPLRAQTEAAGLAVVNWRFDGFIRRRPVATATSLLRAFTSLRRFRPDVVHAVLPTSYQLAMPMARLLGVPVRVASRRSTGDAVPLPGDRRQPYALANRCSTVLVANSNEVARLTVEREHVDPSMVLVIENGVDLPDAVADPSVEPATGVVVAQLRREKGHALLLDALAQLQPPPVVHLLGDGPERARLESRVAELGLVDAVRFDGFVTDPGERLARSQFAVLPSWLEGLPNAVLEAMAHGLPVVATRAGGVPEVITDGVDGLVVPVHDADALAAAIARVVADPGLRVRLGQAARRRVAAYSWDRCVDRHLAVYEGRPADVGSVAVEGVA